MSTYSNVRATVRADVARQALDKAQGEGKTLADVVAELLAGYVEAKPAKRPRK